MKDRNKVNIQKVSSRLVKRDENNEIFEVVEKEFKKKRGTNEYEFLNKEVYKGQEAKDRIKEIENNK